MHTGLTILIVILMFATLGVLIVGLVQMVREPDGRRSNKLMQWRVFLQASAVVLFIIMMTLLRS